MEVITPRPDDLDRALRALGLAETVTVFASGPVNRRHARYAIDVARRRIAELRARPVASTAGRNTSTARLDRLEERLAAAEAALNEGETSHE